MASKVEYNLGTRFFKAGLLAAALGFGLACWETKTNPIKLVTRAIGSSDTASTENGGKEPVAVTPSPTGSTPSNPSPTVVTPERDPGPSRNTTPVAPVTPDPVKVVIKPKSNTLSTSRVTALFKKIEDHLRRGRIFEARQEISSVRQLSLPPEFSVQYRDTKDRVEKYYELLLETTKGGAIEMPLLTEMELKNGHMMVVRILKEDATSYTFETLTGLRAKHSRKLVRSTKKLDKLYSSVHITNALKKQCSYRGVTVEGTGSKPLVYVVQPGRKVTGFHFFEFADFCARNGANNKLVAIFDEALKRDPNILTTVHEIKGERMVNVLLYFLSIGSDDAELTFDLLKRRYTDTRAYRDLLSDSDMREALAYAELETAPAATPFPPPGRDPSPGIRPPDPRPTQRPTSKRRKKGDPTSADLPGNTVPKVQNYVAIGDRNFKKAMERLLNSDPNNNPAGWAGENKKALEYFMKANMDGYLPAQDTYTVNADIPQSLLDRVRETTMRSSMCRKRSVSTRY